MTTERIIPDCMKEETAAEQTSGSNPEIASPLEGKTAVTSRVENLQEGSCPICAKSMHMSIANKIPVHVCLEHSVVMPIRDPELLNV